MEQENDNIKVLCLCYQNGNSQDILLTANPVMYPCIAYALHSVHLGQQLSVGDAVVSTNAYHCFIKRHMPRKEVNSAIVTGERIRTMKVPTDYVFAVAVNLVSVLYHTDDRPSMDITAEVLSLARNIMLYLCIHEKYSSLGDIPYITVKYWNVIKSFIKKGNTCL